jgi:hypothetical protein
VILDLGSSVRPFPEFVCAEGVMIEDNQMIATKRKAGGLIFMAAKLLVSAPEGAAVKKLFY